MIRTYVVVVHTLVHDVRARQDVPKKKMGEEVDRNLMMLRIGFSFFSSLHRFNCFVTRVSLQCATPYVLNSEIKK